MTDKPKFPRADAIAVAKELVAAIKPSCEPDFLKVCGSLRRGKQLVGDVELVYVPRIHLFKVDFFAEEPLNLVDEALGELISFGILAKRLNKNGHQTWGPNNKLALHVKSGIPVDLFSTSNAAWWNYVVCRTGSAENNVAICNAAIAKGWKWHPYDRGFTDREGNWHVAETEQDVFRLAGLPYKPPGER
jgi:DNA polymerase/3'-5' exonuclease PolX